MTPERFFEICKAHDLTYTYSDDGRAWRAGAASYARVIEAAHELPESDAVRIWNEVVRTKIIADCVDSWLWEQRPPKATP